ncbi:zf-HC2 domain-containing protein [Paenibacillus chartarius]|uniref:Anti-sigma-W factor RsiW n=1 Tax=Paenibacillus chartarius TaxID=747481 RepID=A0ABV6DT64_9BACL
MTCQERVELMQRYLDHDVNETEENELLQHLQTCEQCAGLFDRLKRLDEELSQLPRVSPPFSLVDAILPQLAELDRLPATLEETAAKESMTVIPSGGIPRTRRPLLSWKIASGAAVAAAVIGALVLKDQGFSPVNLNGSATMSQEAKGAADQASAGSASTNSNAPKAESAGQAAKTAPTSDPKQNEKAAPSAPSPEPAAASAPRSAPAAVPAPAAGPESQPAARQQDPDDQQVAIASTRETAAPPPAPEEAAPAADNSADAAAAPSRGIQPPEEVVTQGSEQADVQSKALVPPAPQVRPGIASALKAPDAPAPVTMKSPDSKHIASVEELKVVVRQTDTGATVRSSTYGWKAEDVISFISFTEDGKLTYRVQHPNGAEEWLFDVETGAETKLSQQPK